MVYTDLQKQRPYYIFSLKANKKKESNRSNYSLNPPGLKMLIGY